MRQRNSLTRREMLGQSVGMLLAAGLWPGSVCAEGEGSAHEFHFVAVNDLHYLNERCGQWLEQVFRQMKNHPEGIDFCLVSGDLTEHGKPEQMTAVRDLLKGMGKPIHVVIGNHDHLSPDDRKAFDECFPKCSNYRSEEHTSELQSRRD